ncbi:heme/hemin ABC transporter substrate-binding protein [Phreatobacter stygius]|uniref:heme/hemin ABC transporter substrate-binding protein n=1 Tax=Phreatobacter stygius TaxID=1940610 RepID=UPI001FEAC047|nr:ABC transporter substrate-binding protein [Phreatobacter stygius]
MSRRSLVAASGLTAAILAGSLVPALGSLTALAQAAPQRIVAAGGVITEILYALGLQDQIVGVDTTSLHPPQALKDKPNVGYVRALSAEGVLSLKPTLVIAIDGAGPPDTIKLIAEAGIRVERLGEDLTPKGIVERIRAVGRLANATPQADTLADAIDKRFQALAREREALAARKRVLFVLSLQNGRVVVGGRHSGADAIITLAGAVNAAEAVDGYKPLTDEGVIAAAPDVVLVMQRGDHALSPSDVFGLPAFAATPAARNRSLVSMDGLYLLGFGPRTPEAAHDLMAAAYGLGEAAGGRRQ